MAIEVIWDNEKKTVLRSIYGETWTWADWAEADRTTHKMLATVDHTVDFIEDARHTTIPANTLSQLPEIARHSPGLTSNQVRKVVIVGTAAYLQVVVGVFKRVYPQTAQNVYMAADLEEAYKILSSSNGHRA